MHKITSIFEVYFNLNNRKKTKHYLISHIYTEKVTKAEKSTCYHPNTNGIMQTLLIMFIRYIMKFCLFDIQNAAMA